jgi:hypothetical protein
MRTRYPSRALDKLTRYTSVTYLGEAWEIPLCA